MNKANLQPQKKKAQPQQGSQEQPKQQRQVEHISFSAIKNWAKCPFYHKLTYLDRIKGFVGNEYTAFGSAVHSVAEKVLLEENIDPPEYFKHMFSENLKELSADGIEVRQDLINQMHRQGVELSTLIKESVKEYFGEEYEVVSVEERLQEPIKEFVEKEYDFKGFIDLVLKTPDGKYHVVDWKTCSWGWDGKRRSEPMNTYQLIFYKHYFALKHNIDPEDVDVHFGLLKRTAKKDKVELFKITSGKKRTENAIKLLNKALYNITNGHYIKNKLACRGCEFYKTEHCT